MMKVLLGLITATLLAFPTLTYAQQNRETYILTRLDQAISTFDAGQFTFHDKMTKYVSDDDSSYNEHTSRCFVKRNGSDSLMGYQLASFRADGYQQIYDGTHLFTVYDQVLEVTPKQAYPEQIQQQFGGLTGPLYFAATNRMLRYFKQSTTTQHLQLVGLTYSVGQECYQLRVVDSLSRTRRSEVNYYVSTHSFLPVRTVTKLSSLVGGATEVILFDYWVTDIKANIVVANPFSRNRLTDYRIERNYNPAEEQVTDELLPIGSKAPTWQLPLISGKSLSLAALKGKIVILDFWFKACAPCQKQMLSLQVLHEKYSADKVMIVGINTVDDPVKDRLASFLKNRWITMPSVYQGHLIQALYKVYGSPALFVIDKKGVIIYTKSGYSTGLVEEVDRLLAQQLKQ